MKRFSRFSAFFFTLLGLAAIFLIAYHFRSSETPPWQLESVVSTPDTKVHVYPSDENAQSLPFSFLAYNVRNWLISDQSPPKTEASKAAVIRMLVGSKADVIGICEIGSDEDLSEIRTKLKTEGLDLPYSFHTGGTDGVRHLGILSRFPIISSMETESSVVPMRRGILDATILIGKQPIRFIGLHLKSKRIVPDYNEALMRMEEATLARNHLERIFRENPSVRLVAYGDFNDSIGSPSTRAIMGTFRAPDYLTPVHVKDSRGETWTHFYSRLDAYSRIDFVTVSAKMKNRVNKNDSCIIDSPDWNVASDHRPVLVRFR